MVSYKEVKIKYEAENNEEFKFYVSDYNFLKIYSNVDSVIKTDGKPATFKIRMSGKSFKVSVILVDSLNFFLLPYNRSLRYTNNSFLYSRKHGFFVFFNNDSYDMFVVIGHKFGGAVIKKINCPIPKRLKYFYEIYRESIRSGNGAYPFLVKNAEFAEWNKKLINSISNYYVAGEAIYEKRNLLKISILDDSRELIIIGNRYGLKGFSGILGEKNIKNLNFIDNSKEKYTIEVAPNSEDVNYAEIDEDADIFSDDFFIDYLNGSRHDFFSFYDEGRRCIVKSYIDSVSSIVVCKEGNLLKLTKKG
jgi:hypothetical protein